MNLRLGLKEGQVEDPTDRGICVREKETIKFQFILPLRNHVLGRQGGDGLVE